MKNNKGITLVSMIGYVILAIMALAVLVALTTNFKKNFDELDVQAVQDIELDKINMQISKDIKDGKKLDKSNFSSTKLVFIDGNTYTYVSKDKTLYMNDNVAVAEHLRSCVFELPSEDILRVTAQVEDEIRTMEFSIDGVYVARIEKEYYRTLQSAIDAVPANNVETTITVLTNISENTTIAQNQNIVLDIGIYTINNKEDDAVITTSGKLKIQNGKITGNPTEQPLINNKNTGALNIVGGTITSDTSIALGNYGTINISGTAKIDGNIAIANKAEGSITATGGEITSTNSNAINNYGKLEVDANTKILSNRATIYNRKNATSSISGGEINSKDSNAIVNYGALNISNTAYLKSTSSTFPTISNQTNASIIINGGTIISNNSHAINNHGFLEINGNSEMSSESSRYSTIYNQSEAIIKITGGTINSTNSPVLSNEERGEVTISGGNMKSSNSNVIKNLGIVNIKDTAILEGTGNNNPTIYNETSAILTVTGGTIKATKSNAIYNLGTATVSGATIIGSTYGI